jgi:hypothetical protein
LVSRGGVDREMTINEGVFISATRRLFEWSKEQNCRFYTIIRDQAGATNKVRYKRLQQIVQSNFYPLYLSPQRRPAERTTPPSEATNERNSATSDALPAQ